ncbi:class I SAM-dependent methyltransferase [Plantactinospora sp. KLBMP9567]|uniref:class I SAM-dependent methyltransferase n=1 Tax=Plantactinospora sp. KLBMP9567 TaxID=3085900 RepID=UPI0029827549|nr:class I SAM-dependent methyltransferase [Plantactinospora sp. KLBMP9567]MDW5329517.1 class I SAM-dependent methyltransferase [Plantactinospora sp. KLBMP9567]
MTVDAELVAEVGAGITGDVPGWFSDTDQDLFEWFLDSGRPEAPGDIVELGTYLGRSAVHLGRFTRPGERLVVCDLFEQAGSTRSILPSAREFYEPLRREQFEANYLRYHSALPSIVEGLSSTILDHVRAGSCRFVHIDASHRYDDVRADLLAARVMLGPGGVVAVDDYRTAHTPGVAAAVWEAVLTGGLRPVCLSADKFYGVWDGADELRGALLAALARRRDRYAVDEQDVLGHRLARVVRRGEA